MAASRDQTLQAAEKYVARGRLEQALKEYLRLLDENPNDISTLNKVGDLCVRMNRPLDSIPYFIRIADFYALDGFFLKAIAIYKKINKIDPARLEVYERLADLYHKQGLTQDARSQYQVLADHYQKSNKPEEAIAAYKKMAAVDPNDLKIQARLADLYRSTKQTDQAVMQYGLIGNMLLRRGAYEEAAAVFQKALQISPNDAAIQKSLVRSLLAQKNPTAAIAILKAAPRTAESVLLLGEAQLEMGQRAEAGRTAEQSIALDARYEPARVFLCRIRLEEGFFDQAFAAVAPLMDAAMAAGDPARAATFVTPILEREPAHSDSIHKMAEIREADGKFAEAAALRFGLGREAERHGETETAIEQYRKALKAVPGHEEAAARLRAISPGFGLGGPPPAPGPEPEPQPITLEKIEAEPPVHAPQPLVPSIEFEPSLEARPPGAAAVGKPGVLPPGPARAAEEPVASAEEREIETLIVEAEVFAKYGLADKAVQRLRSLVRRRPDLLKARERLVELMVESKNPALPQEAAALAELYRGTGRILEADTIVSRFGLPPPPSRAAAAPRLAEPQPEFEEFEFDLPPHGADLIPGGAAGSEVGRFAPLEPPPEPVGDFGNEMIRLAAPEAAGASAKVSPAFASAPSGEEPLLAPESEFVSYEELGSLLEEEMQRAGEAAAPSSPSSLVLDEQNLFADEQKFFNLAEELEKELAEEAIPGAPAMTGPEGEVSLEEIFREFKKGVEQQLSAEDYETHFNLGIAYKEMGLIDEAIGEFQLSSKDPARAVECCSMLGLCFLEKGMPQLAVKWYHKGLEAPGIGEQETAGLLYDLGNIYQNTGDLELAYRTFLEVYGLNTNYRDIVHRVKDLEGVRKN